MSVTLKILSISLLSIFTCLHNIYSCSGSHINELQEMLNMAVHDSVKLRLLNRFVEQTINYKPDTALNFALKALNLAQKLNAQREIATSLHYIGICYYYMGTYKLALQYYLEAIAVMEQIGDTKALAQYYISIGTLYTDLNNYDKSLEYFLKAIEIAQQLDNERLMSRCFNNIGLNYYYTGHYDDALKFLENSVDIKSKLGDKIGLASTFNNIGEVYRAIEDYQKALDYFELSLKTSMEENETRGISCALSNIGTTYKCMENYEKAEEYFFKSLSILDEQGNLASKALLYFKLGDVYLKSGKLNKVEYPLENSLELALSINSKEILKNIYEAYSNYYEIRGDFENALKYRKLYMEAKDSLITAEASENVANYQVQYETLKKEKELALLSKDRFRKDLELTRKKEEIRRQKYLIITFIIVFILIIGFSVLLYIQYKQKKKAYQLLAAQNEEISQQKEEIECIAEKLEQANTELEQLSIVARKTDNAVMIMDPTGKFIWVNECLLRKYEYSFQELIEDDDGNILKYSAHPDILNIFKQCIANRETIIYESLTVTKKGNKIWTQTTLTPIIEPDGTITKLIAIDSDITGMKNAEAEIQKQSNLLKQKNIQITASIDYASRIQNAILPPEKMIKNYFPQSFIFFRPRDIVSGDFYWFACQNGKIYLAVVDCTGHGVPGAFMSIIGTNLLDDIILDKQIHHLPEILEKLHYRVIKILDSNEQGTGQDDGMDISLCCFDMENNKIEISSTNQVIYVIQNNILKTYRGTVHSIGEKLRRETQFTCTMTTIEMLTGTTIYMFSDGFQDQFSSKTGRKFLASHFRQLLFDMHHLPMSEQYAVLDNTFREWKGNSKQIDDVLIIGVKI
ncbi:MAG: tetratricopeptide repeat protein [Bacteroidia bacterium]|nr:tetratricopeptide repeat protein [Bacteroidia bacterium]